MVNPTSSSHPDRCPPSAAEDRAGSLDGRLCCPSLCVPGSEGSMVWMQIQVSEKKRRLSDIPVPFGSPTCTFTSVEWLSGR